MALFKSNLAGIQYCGEAGITKTCLDAIIRFIQYDDHIKEARILSSGDKYCFLLTVKPNDLIAVKSGFSTGYNGEGPRGFSYILALLDLHAVKIDEYKVSKSLLNHLDNSALTRADLKIIDTTEPVRPQRFHEYISDKDWDDTNNGTLWKNFRPVIPFAIIDNRITDLAVDFWRNPDDMIMTGYRRLEDILRKRVNIYTQGANLFSQIFLGDTPRLHWNDISRSEQVARASLFKDAYSAYRNPRAHKELKNHRDEYLSEFLLLNHLYRLEKDAISV